MDRAEYDAALAQLTGAAELIAPAVAEEDRLHVFETLAFFRMRRQRAGDSTPALANEELFKDSAIAALTMAGRKEYLAAMALLDQARGLMQ